MDVAPPAQVDGTPGGRSRVARVLEAAAWAAVAILALLLSVQRFLDATVSGDVGIDLGFFLDGAEHVADGGDPYDASGYAYTPLLAWLLVPLVDHPRAMPIWVGVELAAGLAAIAFVLLAARDRLAGWRAPLLAGVAVVTLLFSSTVSTELFLGQVQLVLLAIISLAVLLEPRRPMLSGAVLAVAGLLKTWPGMLVLWFLRVGQRKRALALLGVLAAVVAFALVVLVVLGSDGIGRFFERTFGLGEQPRGAYSVWYFARQGVPGTTEPIPLGDAPIGGLVLSGLLAVVVVGLIVLMLLRPGDASVTMWNLVGATILLLPVSHPFYRLLMLPLLWVWLSFALAPAAADRWRRRWAVVAASVLGGWWIVVFRLPPDDDGWLQGVDVAVTLAALAVSVVAAALLPRADAAGSPPAASARSVVE